ncbi:hypothetical protein GCM10018771_63290 [Streptomyces cellulosae]|nr:hypothetical protein GCM10018771_63290 [Streptomyces cellulosae]
MAGPAGRVRVGAWLVAQFPAPLLGRSARASEAHVKLDASGLRGRFVAGCAFPRAPDGAMLSRVFEGAGRITPLGRGELRDRGLGGGAPVAAVGGAGRFHNRPRRRRHRT